MNKSIIRTEKNQNYTKICNIALKDDRLSWRAKGLFAYMMSLPDDWTFYLQELSKHSTDSRGKTRTAFNELGYAGYITVLNKVDKKTKKFIGREITLHENWNAKRIYHFKEYINNFKQKEEKPTSRKPAVGKVEVLLSTNLNKQQEDFFANRSTL